MTREMNPMEPTETDAIEVFRRKAIEVVESELLAAQTSPAGLDHNGVCLAQEVIRKLRSL
jgi:hypothetical protein